jgi:hypothetical protein
VAIIEPLLLSSLAALATSGWVAARHYVRYRFVGPEDRYMSLYGRSAWASSNMDLILEAAPDAADGLHEVFVARVRALLEQGGPAADRLREHAAPGDGPLRFVVDSAVTVDDLLQPREGIWLDLSERHRVRVVWNHMQMDGVGAWEALREAFDPNPPLIPYRSAPSPPPVVPELLGLPGMARRAMWQGQLGPLAGTELHRGFALWPTAPLREVRDAVGAPFNLVTSAQVLAHVFDRHPDVPRLNVGLTVYFPFLAGRNKYGVFTLRVERSSLSGLVRQLQRQVRFPLVNWGITANQSLALSPLPDTTFLRLVSFYRRQIDVLISNLPVGQLPVTVGDIPVTIQCYPAELTLPYYFLLMGTRDVIHVSHTSRFVQGEGFCAANSRDTP